MECPKLRRARGRHRHEPRHAPDEARGAPTAAEAVDRGAPGDGSGHGPQGAGRGAVEGHRVGGRAPNLPRLPPGRHGSGSPTADRCAGRHLHLGHKDRRGCLRQGLQVRQPFDAKAGGDESHRQRQRVRGLAFVFSLEGDVVAQALGARTHCAVLRRDAWTAPHLHPLGGRRRAEPLHPAPEPLHTALGLGRSQRHPGPVSQRRCALPRAGCRAPGSQGREHRGRGGR
mmetsp:Transcript_57491/g.166412  ORF Transcript_57491/g.166412 Transcript_57491/m.166412 type:complete len:228 (+) Transcript_57491:421-1104(+)